MNEKHRISKECKLWKVCRNKMCVKEMKMIYGKNWRKGSILWSLDVCYTLHDFMKKGFVVNNRCWSDIPEKEVIDELKAETGGKAEGVSQIKDMVGEIDD